MFLTILKNILLYNPFVSEKNFNGFYILQSTNQRLFFLIRILFL